MSRTSAKQKRQGSSLGVSPKEDPGWLFWTLDEELRRPELIDCVTFPVVDTRTESPAAPVQVTVSPLSTFTYREGLSNVCPGAFFISNAVFEPEGREAYLGELVVYPYPDGTHTVACRRYSSDGHFVIIKRAGGRDVARR